MHLFILGVGYSGLALARRALDAGWRVGGTVRHAGNARGLQAREIEGLAFDADRDDADAVAARLGGMAASFYGENKRVRNDKIKRAIGFRPAFPSYREGLRALLEAGEGQA